MHGMLTVCTAGLFLCTYVLSLLKSCEATALQSELPGKTITVILYAGSNFMHKIMTFIQLLTTAFHSAIMIWLEVSLCAC